MLKASPNGQEGQSATRQGLSDALEQNAANGSETPTPGEDEKALETKDTWRTWLQGHKQDFAMVLPKHIPVERIMRLALSAMRRNPKLLTCTPASIAGGLLEAAALGLEVNTPLSQASLVPFKNNKTRTTDAQLIIEYQGLIELHYRSGKVQTIRGDVVYEKDIWELEYGTNERLKHIPSPLAPAQRGEILGFYAYARMHGNAYSFTYLSRDETDAARDEFSASFKSDPENSPWTTNYISMGIKTAVRRLSKWVPKSAELSRAVESDYAVISDPFNITDFAPQTPSAT